MTLKRMMTPPLATMVRTAVLLLLLPSYNYSVSSSLLVAAASNCILSDPISIHQDGSVFMEQAADYHSGTFTMRLTYTGGRSYIGIGVNTDGSGKMTPAKAVIGRGYDDGITSNTVLMYDLISDAKDASGVIAMDPYYQTLSETSFVQTESSSILTFTQPLQDDINGLYISVETMWVFAVGLPDNQYEGKHSIHGSFAFTMTPCVYAATDSPTAAPRTPQTTTAADPPTTATTTTTSTTTTGSEGGNTDEHENEDEDENHEDDHEEDHTSSDGVAPNHQDGTIGGGESDNSNDNAIDNNSPSTTSNEASTSGSNTINSSNNLSGGIVFFNTEKPYRKLWAAHGIFMALAWGICAPLGIGAAVFLKRLDRFQEWANSHPNLPKGLWYQIHYNMNLATVGLTLMGLLLAFIATAKEDGAGHLEDTHHKLGWAIVFLCIIQASLAYYRPALPQKAPTPSPPTHAKDSNVPSNPTLPSVAASASSSSSSKTGDTNPTHDVEMSADDMVHPGQSDDDKDEVLKGKLPNTHRNSSGGGDSASSLTPAKSLLRVAWEWSHRLLGLLLLFLAWFNCVSGIELHVENFLSTPDKTGAFWGVTMGICGTMVVGSYLMARK